MAQKVQILLIDDIDGSDADETVTFGLDGTTYEIDLTTARATELRETLAPYVGHARKVTGRSGGGRRSSTTQSGPSARELRDWARSNGWEVSERGRVSQEIREAYEASH